MQTQSATTLEAKKIARKSGLTYISDSAPGIKRIKKGKSFSYVDADGKPVKDSALLGRIKSLVLPPAWENVWISPFEKSHLQATGIDARGRKQYRYHTQWSKVRSENKFSRMRQFADALPKIRKAVEKDISRRETTREKIIATVIQLMEKGHMRVGNAEYAKEYGSFGLTTLRDKHVEVKGGKLKFAFKGKKGIWHEIELNDKRLAKIVQKCKDIPGQELFQYYDENGEKHGIDSGAVNEYLHEVTGEDFTAKDFRTWAGTLRAFTALWQLPPTESKTERKSQLVEVVKEVARRLGNTPTVCKKYYIHPTVIAAYESGNIHRYEVQSNIENNKLTPEEEALVRLLDSEKIAEVLG
ncbi:MAG: DNA topoisomerase IB [Sphingobacteriales bacterium]|nr:MAG: DNA topoisomerase IB [Sphingobacteriales bacterium]